MKRILSILILAFSITLIGGFKAKGQTFTAILKSPEFYDNKQVHIVGIVRGDNVPIEIYADRSEALRMESSQAIRVVLPDRWRQHGPYDLRRARVSGVIKANQHGTWGKNPCSLSLETIDILSGPVASWPDMAVVFRNETATPISLILKTGDVSHSFELLPGQYELEYIKNDGVATGTSRTGALRLKAKIAMHPSAFFYDAVNAASYYRITEKRIEMVLPSVAKSWGWKR